MQRSQFAYRVLWLCITYCFLSTHALFAQQSSGTQQKANAKADGEKKRHFLIGLGPFKHVVTARFVQNGKVYYGRPLGQDQKKLAMLRWDGRINIFPRQKKLEFFSKGFAPYTHEELSKRLQKQYGSRYLTQTSDHFIVVHPRTSQKKWAAKYEAVYRQFRDYLARHKIDIAEPKFPLVVVVLGSRKEFDRSLADQVIFQKNVFGFYSRITNRVTTFTSSDPRISRQVERVANVTVVHEAIHQLAFNTGVHNRLCAVPRWMTEGFAMLFESSGFRKSNKDQPITKRTNGRRLAMLKKMFLTGQVKGNIETMIRDDRLFETDPDLAYSLSWGLSFYLAEKEKGKYLQFVIDDGNRNQFQNYTPNQRIEYFTTTFGTDFDRLERKLKKFILDLPQ